MIVVACEYPGRGPTGELKGLLDLIEIEQGAKKQKLFYRSL